MLFGTAENAAATSARASSEPILQLDATQRERWAYIESSDSAWEREDLGCPMGRRSVFLGLRTADLLDCDIEIKSERSRMAKCSRRDGGRDAVIARDLLTMVSTTPGRT
jgi:hypothetical protein